MTDTPANWSNSCPPDLAKALDQIGEYRSAPASSDIWGVMKEWLEAHGLEPPADLQK